MPAPADGHPDMPPTAQSRLARGPVRLPLVRLENSTVPRTDMDRPAHAWLGLAPIAAVSWLIAAATWGGSTSM
jgi:hypothetical protein